ncbi:MAG: ZIP family metal transporter [Marinicaulis sp.]|nr:ZIP family metal transporter [Marinicaulis sp.]NNE40095.1 ZIP family metal transporter [Marinicaulis sp.]NNL88418.1 ZIP family metal transporter [Marinicaulis sp.]
MFGDPTLFFGVCASIVAAAISTAGIITVAAAGDWARRNSSYLSALAVGLLTVAVLFHLLPEAAFEAKDARIALAWVAGGFATMVLIGIAVEISVHQRSDGAALTFGYASIIALGVHSFIDGFIYAIVFTEDTFTGWFSILGLLFHEFPEGVIAFFLLSSAGLSRFRSLLFAFIASSLTTFSGALLAAWVLSRNIEPAMEALLGTAAGALLYVLIFHLGPHAAKTPNKQGYLVAMVGVALATAALIFNMTAGAH